MLDFANFKPYPIGNPNMKLLATIAILAICLGTASAQQSLTNDSIIKMAKAGMSDGIIISTIHSEPANFTLSANDLIALKQAGVSDQVMAAMIAKTSPAVPTNTAAPSVSAIPSGTLLLREGTDVPLKFAQPLSSKSAAEGDPVAFILDSDLKVGDIIVAKAGSKAFGEVSNVQKSGMMGKAGQLNVRLNYLKVGNLRIKLRGTKDKEGQSGTTGAIVLTVLFGPIGLIKHGKNINIPQGAPLTAYISDDTPVPSAA
jgi:hypothetical protein